MRSWRPYLAGAQLYWKGLVSGFLIQIFQLRTIFFWRWHFEADLSYGACSGQIRGHWGSEEFLTLALASGVTIVRVLIQIFFKISIKLLVSTKTGSPMYKCCCSRQSQPTQAEGIGFGIQTIRCWEHRLFRWELIGQDLGRCRRSYRWNFSAPGSTNHKDVFQRM